MRRAFGIGLVAALLVLGVMAAPAAGASRGSIAIDAPTTFDEIPDTFSASGIPGCATGIVENGPVNFAFPPPHGIYAGYKVFFCDGSDSGFVLRLNARFGSEGSVGTWAVIRAWGDVAGMDGSGPLTGEPIDNGILDHYRGTATFR